RHPRQALVPRGNRPFDGLLRDLERKCLGPIPPFHTVSPIPPPGREGRRGAIEGAAEVDRTFTFAKSVCLRVLNGVRRLPPCTGPAKGRRIHFNGTCAGG